MRKELGGVWECFNRDALGRCPCHGGGEEDGYGLLLYKSLDVSKSGCKDYQVTFSTRTQSSNSISSCPTEPGLHYLPIDSNRQTGATGSPTHGGNHSHPGRGWSRLPFLGW